MNTQTTNLKDADADDLRAMGLPPAFTFDELRETGFSDEEIAQMAEGDDPLVDLPEDFKAPAPKGESARETIRRAKLGEGADDSADDENPDGDEGADDLADDEGEGNGEPENGEDGDEGDTGEDQAQDETGDEAGAPTTAIPEPTLDLKDASEAQAVIDKYEDDLAALQDQYDDGELTSAEMRAQMKELNAAHIKAQRQVEDAERHNAAQQEAYQDAWYSKTAAHMEANPEFSDQKPIAALGGYSAIQLFDQSLRFVTGDARYATLSMDQKIAEADRIARAYAEQQGAKIGKAEAKPAPKEDPKPKADAKAKEPGPRTDKRPPAPQTLANVPAATDNELEDSKFAAIDNEEDPELAEQMIARLSEAERDAYLRGV